MHQQQHLIPVLWSLQNYFDKAFVATQQLIAEKQQQIMQQHLKLEAQRVLAFIQQFHNHQSLHNSPPPKPTPPPAVIYFCMPILHLPNLPIHLLQYIFACQNLLAMHFTPVAPSSHWEHRI